MTSNESTSARLLESLEARAIRHMVEFDGGRVCWRQFGEGPPLVMLHGGHGSWRHWARNIDALSACFTLWVADLPGYGDSDKPGSGPSLLAELVAATTSTLDKLVGPSTELDVVGFSFGTLVALQMAGLRGGVRRLALLGAAGHGGPRRPRGELLGWKDALRNPDPAVLAGVMRHNLGLHMLHDLERIDDLALAIHTASCLNTRFRSRDISRAGGLQTGLAGCVGDVLLAWGEHDVTAEPETLRITLAAAEPRREARIVAGAGHWVQYEAADAINQMLLGWLSAGPARAGA